MGPRLVISLLVLGMLAAPAAPAGEALDLPNLVPQAPHGIGLALAEDGSGRLAIRFAITTQNLGEHPLELLGARPQDPAAMRTAADQCVRWASRACLLRGYAGSFVWHREHAHWHFEDYALYEVRRLEQDGTPMMGSAGLVADGGKASFCLIDTEPTVAGPPDPTDPIAFTGWYQLCLGAYQGISPGWSDTYHRDLPGQEVVMDRVPAGRYALVVTVDPDDRLRETDETDNVAWAAFDHLG